MKVINTLDTQILVDGDVSRLENTGSHIYTKINPTLKCAAAMLHSTVSGNALAIAMVVAAPITLSHTSAMAGTCTANTAGVYICSGDANAGTDVEQIIFSPTGGAVTVSTTPGFGMAVNSGSAIRVIGGLATTDIAIVDANASSITSNGATAISAVSYGSGEISITTTGAVNGVGDYSNGIYTLLVPYGTNVTIDAQGDVMGGYRGIAAVNYGSGAVSITTMGTVTGNRGEGIIAGNRGTDLTINALGDVVGNTIGINANNYGNDVLTITTTGNVTGGNDGIVANNHASGTSLTIDARGDVRGSSGNGINATNQGNGAVSITTSGTVSGDRNGIEASSNGDDLTIIAQGDVTGGNSAIYATQNGTGNVSITTTGTVMSAASGIVAFNRGGTDLTIDAQGDVIGTSRIGIYGGNQGSGAMSITAAGNVRAGILGILANNNAGTDLTINTLGDVIGGDAGISADNSGSGALSITTSGTVTGGRNVVYSSGDGIYAVNRGTSLTLVAQGDVTGGRSGISARNEGSGDLSITSSGTVTGLDREGIRATNFGNGAINIITSGAVSGNRDGIRARNLSNGAVNITTSGIISGSRYGIDTYTYIGGHTSITLDSGSVVSSATGIAINNGASNSTTRVNAGASVNGSIRLGDGSDDLIFAGGDFSGVTIFDGGDDSDAADTFIDSLIFAGSSGKLDEANLLNWENIIIGAGSKISFSNNRLTIPVLDIVDNGVLDAGTTFTLTGDLTTSTGGTFAGSGGGIGDFTVIGNVTNNGIISTQDGFAGDVFTATGNYIGGGQMNIDTMLGGSGTSLTDLIVVMGASLGGTTTINVANSGGNGDFTGTGATDGIKIVQIGGTSNSSAFKLANGVVYAGAFAYTLSQADNQDWYLQSGVRDQVFGFSALQTALRDDVDTMGQRRGQRRRLLNAGEAKNTADSGFWVRLAFSDVDADATTTVKTTTINSNLDYTRFLAQFGYDHTLSENNNSTLNGGLFGQYKRLTLDAFDANGKVSKVTANGYGWGGSLTWENVIGFYSDITAQVTFWDTQVNGLKSGAKDSIDVTTYSASLEAGYRIDIASNLSLVPQAQLVWRGGDFENFTNDTASITYKDEGSTIGRLGIALEANKPVAKNGKGLTSYIIANILRDFDRTGSVLISGTTIDTQTNRTRFEGRAGLNLDIRDSNMTLFVEAGFEHSFSGDNYSGVKGSVGGRIKF
ncbi:MAG: hypothetical protein COA47_03155 [Robiginitomaculum sp.]|nr:MAG: hypothetical protein COA47_03155 [Robiginitomaculum sp.]